MKQIVKKINFLKVAEVILSSMIVFAPLAVSAQINAGNNSQLCSGTGLNCQGGNVNTLIKTIINCMLSIAFAVAVLFLIIGGFWYITSAGNEETAGKGKGTVINAIIGIVVIILSYVIINVVSGLVANTNNSGVSAS